MPHIKKSYYMTTTLVDFFPLTHDIAAALKESGAENGIVHVVVPKAGAGLFIFKNSPELQKELSAAVQPTLLPRSLTLPVVNGETPLAPYEEVILVDVDPRSQRREVVIAVTVEGGKAAES